MADKKTPFGLNPRNAYNASNGKRGQPAPAGKVEKADTKEWTLSSGKVAVFHEVTVAAEDVETLTFVGAGNGRNQNDLNEVNLSSMVNSIKRQQYYPAIATKESDGRYNLSDGSRRRLSAILAGRPLVILYTTDVLSRADALALAKELQSGVEHSLRDLGSQIEDYIAYKKDLNEPVDQKTAAVYFGVSETKVSNALCAWRINPEWIEIFPYINKLSIANYKALTKQETELEKKKIEITSFVNELTPLVSEIADSVDSDEYIAKAFAEIKLHFSASLNQSVKPQKNKPRPIFDEFSNKNSFARVKDMGNRKVVYEFGSLDQKLLADIEQLISEKIKAHYAS